MWHHAKMRLTCIQTIVRLIQQYKLLSHGPYGGRSAAASIASAVMSHPTAPEQEQSRIRNPLQYNPFDTRYSRPLASSTQRASSEAMQQLYHVIRRVRGDAACS